MLFKRWVIVHDVGSALKQHWVIPLGDWVTMRLCGNANLTFHAQGAEKGGLRLICWLIGSRAEKLTSLGVALLSYQPDTASLYHVGMAPQSQTAVTAYLQLCKTTLFRKDKMR